MRPKLKEDPKISGALSDSDNSLDNADEPEDLYSFQNNKEANPFTTEITRKHRPPPAQFQHPKPAPQENWGEPEVNNRPMTSVNAAGYKEKKDTTTGPSLLVTNAMSTNLKKRSENSPEEQADEMERDINRMVEDSADFIVKKDYTTALDKGRQAIKKERVLAKFREENNLDENLDAKFSVQYNLAVCFEKNLMYTEALDTYASIVKNQSYSFSQRFRVNMGDIHMKQKKIPMAIKMYRMALDQTSPQDHQEIRNKIQKNLGVAFVKLGQYHDAISYFEQVVETSNNCMDTAFNLLVCYYAIGEKKSIKKGFRKLLSVKIPGLESEDAVGSLNIDDIPRNDHENDAPGSASSNLPPIDAQAIIKNDLLQEFMKDKVNKHYDLILKGAKLIASIVDENWEKGYDYVIEQVRTFAAKRENCHLVGEMEMAKALNYLNHNEFQKAIEALKSFEKKEKTLQARAATNLSFLFFLERDLKNAQKYAQLAVENDKYNAKALVNLGNCHFMNNDFKKAKVFYAKALTVEADCSQALYNLGLVDKEMQNFEEALKSFEKLHTFLPESIEVLYQIGSIHAKMQNISAAVECFNRLITRVPTDPVVLYKLGMLYARENDETQSYNCFVESYRLYPVILDVISWLGIYFVNNEIYEKACQYFDRASKIQPKEVTWKMMVASCHRRIGAYQQAKKCYEQILKEHPENYEALKYLVQICFELGLKEESDNYSKQLQKLGERKNNAKKNESITNEEDEDSEGNNKEKIEKDNIVLNVNSSIDGTESELDAIDRMKEAEKKRRDKRNTELFDTKQIDKTLTGTLPMNSNNNKEKKNRNEDDDDENVQTKQKVNSNSKKGDDEEDDLRMSKGDSNDNKGEKDDLFNDDDGGDHLDDLYA